MNGWVVARSAGVFQARAFEHASKVFERDTAIDLDERPLDDVLELDRVNGTRSAEGEQVSPGFRGEPSPFMGSHNSKCHTEGQTVIHSRNLFPDKGASKAGR